jgi:hypothetical protein
MDDANEQLFQTIPREYSGVLIRHTPDQNSLLRQRLFLRNIPQQSFVKALSSG